MRTLLKVIVGSQAHGLATADSDFDYRGVFAVPTSQMLKIGADIKNSTWIEGKEDDTAWEVSKFLLMAAKSNPTVLETFLAPISTIQDEGSLLRDLFPHVWNSNDVMNAFIGYGHNQRKKFLDNQDNRAPKFACAYLRVLYNGWQLLSTGTFSVSLIGSPVFDACKRFKAGQYKMGEVIDICSHWENKVREAYLQNPDKKTNIEPVNEFLLDLRKNYWL